MEEYNEEMYYEYMKMIIVSEKNNNELPNNYRD